MKILQLPFYFVITLFAVLSPTTDIASGQSPSTNITVVSFNIRYGTAADGVNHWDKRREFLVETIKTLNPDLLGTQETLGFQRDYLAKELAPSDHFAVMATLTY